MAIEVDRWYVVHTKPHKEAWAQRNLLRRGVEVFFPQLRLPHARPRQQPIVPLFPRYLFVHLTQPTSYDAARWAPGVSRIVSFHHQPAPVADEVIAFLQQRTGPDGILSAPSPLVVGHEVEVGEGPFAGLAGIIARPPDAKGRVQILLELLRRPVKVDVPAHILTSSRKR
jgi:transcriptional antiterminator RfaH